MYSYLSSRWKIWLGDFLIKIIWNLQLPKKQKKVLVDTQKSWVTMYFS